MKIPVITSIYINDGKLYVGRAAISLPDGFDAAAEPCEPLEFPLDPGAGPAFSPHPGGGWASMPAAVVESLVAAGVEPDYEVVKCRCQRGELADGDADALRRTGHAASCPRHKPPTPPPAPAPAFAPPPAPLPLGSSPAVAAPAPRPGINQAILDQVYREAGEGAPAAKPPAPVPPGGLSDADLEKVVATLDGATGVTLAGTLAELGFRDASVQTVSGQMWKDYYFSKCQNPECGGWFRLGPDRRCQGCSSR